MRNIADWPGIDPHDQWVLEVLRTTTQDVSDPVNDDEGPARDVPLTHCWYCGHEGKNTRDHQFPKSRGGSGRRSNLVDACWPCNNQKRARTVEEYRHFLEGKTGSPVVFYGERP